MPRKAPPNRFQDLVDAATAVFIALGYRRTQMIDVANTMGVAKGTLYLYVESKEALFDAAVRCADQPRPVVAPAELPVRTPASEATLAEVERRLADGGALPVLANAVTRSRVTNPRGELEAVLGELYDALARNRTGIKLIDRCALDYPELAQLWYRAGRESALSLIEHYLDDRARRGRFRRFADTAVAARIVLETLLFWSVHRHWDPRPQDVDEATARATAIQLIASALIQE